MHIRSPDLPHLAQVASLKGEDRLQPIRNPSLTARPAVRMAAQYSYVPRATLCFMQTENLLTFPSPTSPVANDWPISRRLESHVRPRLHHLEACRPQPSVRPALAEAVDFLNPPPQKKKKGQRLEYGAAASVCPERSALGDSLRTEA